MQTNLEGAVKNTFHLFMANEPLESTRSYVERNKAGEPVGDEITWDEQVLRGIWLTNQMNPNKNTELEISVRPNQIKSTHPNAPKFSDVLKTFIYNKEALESGKKYVIAHTVSVPKERRSGDKEGIFDTLVPVLTGIELADSNPADLEFIERVMAAKSTTGEEPVVDTAANS